MNLLDLFWILLSAAPLTALALARPAPRAASRALAVWITGATLYWVMLAWGGAAALAGGTTLMGKLLAAAVIGAVMFPALGLWNGHRRALFVPLVAMLLLVLAGLRLEDGSVVQLVIWLGALAGAVASGFLLVDDRLEAGDAGFALGPPLAVGILVLAWSTFSGREAGPRPPPRSEGSSVLDQEWQAELEGEQAETDLTDLLPPSVVSPDTTG